MQLDITHWKTPTRALEITQVVIEPLTLMLCGFAVWLHFCHLTLNHIHVFLPWHPPPPWQWARGDKAVAWFPASQPMSFDLDLKLTFTACPQFPGHRWRALGWVSGWEEERGAGHHPVGSSQDQLIPILSNSEMAADPEELERRALKRVNLYSELLLLTHSCLKNITPPSLPALSYSMRRAQGEGRAQIWMGCLSGMNSLIQPLSLLFSTCNECLKNLEIYVQINGSWLIT